LREAIEQLEGSGYGEAFEDVLRDLFLGLREFGPGEIPNDWRDMYQQMLEELAELDEDRRWEEEDLSDDIDREQERRLEDLEEWLAEERAAIDRAYEDKIAQEQERYADEQAARREDYERKLEDLRIAQEREREEIQREHERRIQEIRRQAERERAELAQTYDRRIEDLTIEYNRERELIGQKLEEQNQTARDKYEEALRDIAIAKEREREEINKQFDRTKDDIEADYKEAVNIAADEFGLLPGRLEDTWSALKIQAAAEVNAWADIVLAGFGRVQDEASRMGFLGNSPAPWWQEMAESWSEGIEAGFDGAAMTANITAAIGDLQSAIPANTAAMPMGMMGGRSSTVNNNLSVTAQYQHQSEASLRDDLSLYNNMLRAYGR
jgi:hypothetical protein